MVSKPSAAVSLPASTAQPPTAAHPAIAFDGSYARTARTTAELPEAKPAAPVAAAQPANGTPTVRSARRQLRPLTGSVGVVGLGYVGLPTALSIHSRGGDVVGYDCSTARIDAITRAQVDLLDDDHAKLARALGSARFTVTADPAAIRSCMSVLICVPTPVDPHDTPDLNAVRSACKAVVDQATPGQLIVLTSTSYIGTTRQLLVEPLERRGFTPGIDIFIAFSPERIDPANAAFPQHGVPRVVGGVTAECANRARTLLERAAADIYVVSTPEAAEMTKLHENTFRAVNLAYVNEMADVASHLGIDIREVIAAASTKPYGFMPFHPGPGVGGHCIPCDPHYLRWQLRAMRLHAPVIDQAMTAISTRPGRVVHGVRARLAERGIALTGATIGIVGVAYKPDVEDVRESPALHIIDDLRRAGSRVLYLDPHVPTIGLTDGTTLERCDPPTMLAADALVIHTLHAREDLGWAAAHPLVIDATYRCTIAHAVHP